MTPGTLAAWVVIALTVLVAGITLFALGLPGWMPRRGRRRMPKENPRPAAVIPQHWPSTEDDDDPPIAQPAISKDEHAQFWEFVYENPALSSRLTQLWAGVEIEEESAS